MKPIIRPDSGCAATSFASRANQIAGSKTSGMRNLAASMKEKGIPIVNFAAGELDVPISEKLRAAAIKAIQGNKHKYTDTLGIPALRESIANRLTRNTGSPWSASEIAVTAGAKQALFNTAMTLFQAGDEVLVPAPYWTTFPTQIEIAGAKPVFVDTSRDRYELTFEAISGKSGPATKGIILNSPNNPTGKIVKPDVLSKIADWAARNGIWVIFDQCYADFVHDGHAFAHMQTMNQEIRPLLVIIDSFSKSHAIPGWRVGYVAGSRELIKSIGNIQSHTTSNPNSVAQTAMVSVLEGDDSEFRNRVQIHLRSNRDAGLEILSGLRDVDIVQPEGGFYFYLNISKRLESLSRHENGPGNIDDVVQHLLKSAHVAVVGGTAFGDANGIRLSYGMGAEEMATGLKNLVVSLNSWAPSAAGNI